MWIMVLCRSRRFAGPAQVSNIVCVPDLIAVCLSVHLFTGRQDNGKYTSSSSGSGSSLKRKHDETLSDEFLAMLKVRKAISLSPAWCREQGRQAGRQTLPPTFVP